jgi:hypothetical protein
MDPMDHCGNKLVQCLLFFAFLAVPCCAFQVLDTHMRFIVSGTYYEVFSVVSMIDVMDYVYYGHDTAIWLLPYLQLHYFIFPHRYSIAFNVLG